MTGPEVLIGLNLLDIGKKSLDILMRYFEKPQNIIFGSCQKLNVFKGLRDTSIMRKIGSLGPDDINRELELIKKNKLKVMTIFDEDYPKNLKEIYDPPIVLYILGKLNEQDNFSIAVVGSRRASLYGLNCTDQFVQQLTGIGFTIVSGMARGIDTQAHKSSLKAGGRTVAVMGSGFCHIYPPENKGLTEKIAESGAVISEFSCLTKPLARNFPRRNRIINGLSLGVLVVEAARNSGALITADSALEQGREVFCLPGRLDANNSFGTHALIKQGAKLVSSLEDILEELNLDIKVSERCKNQNKDIAGSSQDSKLSCEEAVIYNMVRQEPVSLDEILKGLNLEPASVMKGLLNLEARRYIRRMPGKQFVRQH